MHFLCIRCSCAACSSENIDGKNRSVSAAKIWTDVLKKNENKFIDEDITCITSALKASLLYA